MCHPLEVILSLNIKYSDLEDEGIVLSYISELIYKGHCMVLKKTSAHTQD